MGPRVDTNNGQSDHGVASSVGATFPPTPPSHPHVLNTSTVFPLVLSTGAAFGNHYTTQQMLDALIHQQTVVAGNQDFDVDFAKRVFEKCGYKTHSVALALPDVFRRLSRDEYLQHRAKNLSGLAEQAAELALSRWGRPRGEITHLFWGTMTGAMSSPTIDIQLVKRLGLHHDVERTSIEGMGCLTGFRLLNLARQVVQADTKARVLVIAADLRSAIGNSLPDKPTRTDIVSAALFRDAASSAVVGKADLLRDGEHPCYEIITGLSRVTKETHHLVMYSEANDGVIRLHLDRKLPDHIGMVEPDFVGTLLEKGTRALDPQGDVIKLLPPVSNMDILCHTGGPRVLQMVAQSLGTNKDRLSSSWNIMTAHGNLSGASNLAVLDHHNNLPERGSEWAVCLSMGPGVCLDGVLLRDARVSPSNRSCIPRNLQVLPAAPTYYRSDLAVQCSKRVIHIVGGGIAGLTLAVTLDPDKFDVRVFEASQHVGEMGYGMAVWPSMMRILRDELGVTGLDLARSESMAVRPIRNCLDVKVGNSNPDKGFTKRSHLLDRIKARLEERHPGCISTGHTCMRVRFEDGMATATYEKKRADGKPGSSIVSHTCNLLVGADGVNSAVRRYVALKSDTKSFGHMTAYRFLVPNPSEELVKETREQWNMSLGKHIHSPCYQISSKGNALNVVVLEYDGKPPGPPHRPCPGELMDVAIRGELNFVIKLLQTEDIEDLACYSTYHVDCEPWVQPCAAIVGDAAHAFGPLTAKMANLAVNDSYTLATMLNDGFDQQHHPSSSSSACKVLSQGQILQEWEDEQRPKFQLTRTRTLRHLQLYSPQFRGLVTLLWAMCPGQMLKYFGSIFAYDYAVFDPKRKEKRGKGTSLIVGSTYDPLLAVAKRLSIYCGLFFLSLALAIVVSKAIWKHNRISSHLLFVCSTAEE
uniref:FAD-binding domain-containing protein n=1 Tax=Grammatophora oceanica TaxID=210454 RepID=A0A7S1Y785_9STRA|mmetsp:Transcript_27439/g.40278  ORF Transcript_27439/g.40278 Transcript_27439/m.40278 type:complete len:924 (+) Transcript_27439:67-2838(+)